MCATPVGEAVLAFSTHEHRDLARGIDRIHDAACALGRDTARTSLIAIRDVLAWTATTLEPHLAWEETWLYPRIETLTGTAWATRPARYHHGQVRRQVERLRDDELDALRQMTPALVAELRCRLFSLEALVRAHVDHEEWLLGTAVLDAPPALQPASPPRSA